MINCVKLFVSLILVICGIVMICVGCFHPDVSRDGSFWGGVVGVLFVASGYVGIMNTDN